MNPHKSSIGLGNYDVNVITAALNSKDHDIVWFDKRKDSRTVNLEVIKVLENNSVFVFILNKPHHVHVYDLVI